MATITHFGDPCIHCGVNHDEVLPGDCKGDTKKSIPGLFRSLGVRWDNVEHFLVLFSDGHTEDRWNHISEHAASYHFGYSSELVHPPPYSQTLRRVS